eukprot:EC838646.1.p2 GENE.EC838646.1~~EC838646.1.p2  ORF type:complete len:211 (+),score=36.72 EC838646.1:33-635(+)
MAVPVNVSTWRCWLNQGFSFASVRAYHSFGEIDENAPDSIANAIEAGFAPEDMAVYHFACCCGAKKSADVQVAEMVDYLAQSQTNYSIVWFDVETNPSRNCGWSTDSDTNCAFLKDLISAAASRHLVTGIYASKYMWQSIMGGDRCTVGGDLPLWYPRYNQDPSFQDWAPFGGWTQPYMKQDWDHEPHCGVDADVSWRPN